jgi:hypothetical protein
MRLGVYASSSYRNKCNRGGFYALYKEQPYLRDCKAVCYVSDLSNRCLINLLSFVSPAVAEAISVPSFVVPNIDCEIVRVNTRYESSLMCQPPDSRRHPRSMKITGVSPNGHRRTHTSSRTHPRTPTGGSGNFLSSFVALSKPSCG